MKERILPCDKLFNEIYALIKLQHIDSRFKSVSVEEKLKGNMESPDLQSTNFDYGIEVTRAYPEYLEKEYALLRTLSNRGKSSKEYSEFIENTKFNKKLKNKIIIEDSYGHAVVSVDDDCLENHIDSIRKAIIKKNEKILSDNFAKFKTNYLYISCEELLDDKALLKAISNLNIEFDIVFFDCGFTVYEYNVKTMVMICNKLTGEELTAIKSKALLLHKPEWANV